MEHSETTFEGKPAYRTYLTTSTNKRADKLFVMRDTLTSFTDMNVTPLYYTKRAHEGKYFRVDAIRYSYPKGKCRVKMSYSANHGPEHPQTLQSNECIYDMVSMMLRARSFDPTGWNEGQRRNFIMADGRDCGRQSIVFRGRRRSKWNTPTLLTVAWCSRSWNARTIKKRRSFASTSPTTPTTSPFGST